MNTLRFSSLSAAVLLASVSGLCLAQADVTAAATQNTNVAVTMQQQNTIQPSSANAAVSAKADSSVSAGATTQSTSSPGQNSPEQSPEEPLQNTTSQTALTGGFATGLSQSAVEQPGVALAQSTSVTQQSSAAVSALFTPAAVTLPELPSAASVVAAELPALSGLANESAQAAISQSTSTVVQQQINTELTKAVDDTIKAEVVNSVQSSLTSALNLGL